MFKITPPIQRFILHWGEMGGRWGVNRSVAQIHGLLFLAPAPLTADQICDLLGIARSNVSNSLKELQSWGLVKLVHVMGDRRDHFTALKDVQETFNTIVEGRKQREIDPTLALLAELSDAAKNDNQTEPHAAKQISDMLTFLDQMTRWYDEVKKLPNETLMKIARMGSRIVKLLWL